MLINENELQNSKWYSLYFIKNLEDGIVLINVMGVLGVIVYFCNSVFGGFIKK